MKDHTKVLGFGTNRVVGKALNRNALSAGQMKSINTLQTLCGVKNTDKDNSLIDKIANIKKTETKSKILSVLEDEEKDKNKENVEDRVEKAEPVAKKPKISLKNLL